MLNLLSKEETKELLRINLLTIKEAAELLNLKISTVYAMVHQQKLPAYKLGPNNGTIRISLGTIKQYLEENSTMNTPRSPSRKRSKTMRLRHL